jgi:hypothetical protein
MNIKEIINRSNGSSYTLEEMCYIIEQYVLIKKNKNITLNPYKNCIFNNRLNGLYFKIEVKKVIKAFNDAIVFLTH